MSFMKDLYDQINEAVKKLKIKPCLDTYTELEKLLNRSIPSDGSEDVVKYYTFKMLLKSKAIIPGNITSNDSIRYMALWMTPEMIVRHFDLQNYIDLTFTQSNRFVQGDFIRGDYTVKESTFKSRESREPREQTPTDKKDEYTIVGSRKSHLHTTSNEVRNNERNKHQKNTPRHNSTSSMTRTVRYKNDSNNNPVKKEKIRLTKSFDQIVESNIPNTPNTTSTSSTSSTSNTSNIPNTDNEPNLRSSINWNASTVKNWADEEDSD